MNFIPFFLEEVKNLFYNPQPNAPRKLAFVSKIKEVLGGNQQQM
ncbi:hypothetical protein C1A50_3819 [Paenibacillus polymyxa]|nr:hypothetical protein C1A50_3819 [Paenibacillus polymyxa]